MQLVQFYYATNNFNPEERRLPKKIDVLVEDITIEFGFVLGEIE